MGARIFDLRKRLGVLLGRDVSTREVDRAAKIAPGYTWALETGVRPNPAAWVVKNVADAFGATTDYVMAGKGEGPTDDAMKTAYQAAISAGTVEEG